MLKVLIEVDRSTNVYRPKANAVRQRRTRGNHAPGVIGPRVKTPQWLDSGRGIIAGLANHLIKVMLRD
jgi:hypothetical protein